jgi:hypothetical protein
VNYIDNEVLHKSDAHWEENRFENLNKDEKGVQNAGYLKTVNTSLCL